MKMKERAVRAILRALARGRRDLAARAVRFARARGIRGSLRAAAGCFWPGPEMVMARQIGEEVGEIL